MSLLKKIRKGIVSASKILPAVAGAFPSSKTLSGAAQAFQTGAQIAQFKPALPAGGAQGVTPMSIAGASLPSFPGLPTQQAGVVKTGLPLVAGAVALGSSLLARAPAAGTAIVAAGRAALPFIKKNAAKALGWITVGALVYDTAGNLMGRTSKRQMNPLNQRAARRAIRRIKRVRKIASSIERALPKSKSRRC